ncbi:hypothetical protein [Streptomyces sp. NPDC021608]|uniref:hypothetical protein n=1 Tax=Streptomyces sp. NPDC021608 TaxID=3154903 RepID=UPI0033F571B7
MTLPNPAFAAEEQHRADGMAARAAEISASPGHPSSGSLSLYQSCARTAYEAAAANEAQPEGWQR